MANPKIRLNFETVGFLLQDVAIKTVQPTGSAPTMSWSLLNRAVQLVMLVTFLDVEDRI